MERLRIMITRLMQQGEFGPTSRVSSIETHISIVVLAADYCWKFKKPVDLGFLDFSTLERRRYMCSEELRLNQRFAPDYYLAVVAVTGSDAEPRLAGDGPAVEYCVKMRRFASDSEFSALLPHGGISKDHIEKLARMLAEIHQRTPAAPLEFGTQALIQTQTLDNLQELQKALPPGHERADDLPLLRAYVDQATTALAPHFIRRYHDGFIRECHGDLHLGNIALDEDTPVIFDCVEFSEALRYIDVMSDLAFVLADLCKAQRPDLGARLIDEYLAYTGDYQGLCVLRYYAIYRALVRAKVLAIDASQHPLRKQSLLARCNQYLSCAVQATTPPTPFLLITHGLSGSGKSTLAAELLGLTSAVRIRSDVERKRLFGLTATQDSASPVAGGLYTSSHSTQTYSHMLDTTRMLLENGFPVIVDAAFLKRAQRSAFATLAARTGIHFRILNCTADIEVLRQRLAARARKAGQPSEADDEVLNYQLETVESLTTDELKFTLDGGNSTGLPVAAVAEKLAQTLKHIDRSSPAPIRAIISGD